MTKLLKTKLTHFWLVLVIIGFSMSVSAQCNVNTTICTPGTAGPFNFIPASNNPSSCLDFTNGQAAPNYAYIILYITQGGDLNLLITGDQNTGFLDVSIFDITGEQDPCGSLSTATEIGCNYATDQNGCNQFGTDFPCTSTVPAPVVNTGDVLMILVEDWDDVMSSFTLDLGTSPGSAQTGPPDATINTPPTVCATGSPIQLTAVDNGGTWSGPGIDPTGLFDPTTVGVGTYTIDYVVGSVPCQSTDQATIEVIDCTVPTPCPFYDNTPIAEYKACGEQLYDFTVMNTACPAIVCFDVVGNYGSFGGEISWEIVSVTSGNIVASGGPGSSNTAIFVPVCVDPNIEGTTFNMIVYDSFGDGFSGGGFLQIEDNGSVIAGPIDNDFGSQTNQVFASNVDISPTTLTINTPSGPIVNNIGNCADHDVQFVLNNTNFCTPINVSMPWQIVCDITGTVLSSGTHDVVVYPQIPNGSSDLVDITWNSITCQWDVTAQNDCDLLDIGSIFTISPDPSAWPTNTCSAGSQDFTIDYLGVQGSPDCCATGGPLVPITYNTSTVVGDAVVASSPYGGLNNSAYTTILPNGEGGLSTSFNLTISGTNFCYDPPDNNNDYNYYIAVWVDGAQVLLDGPNCCNNSNFTVTVTDADLLAAGVIYDQNSVIDVYVLPNNFWVDPCCMSPFGCNPPICPSYTTYNPGASCPSGLGDGDWTVDDLTMTLNATFTEQTAGPAVCTFVTSSPHTCCVIDLPTASNPANIDVECPADVPAPDPTVVTDEAGGCNPVVSHVSDATDGQSCPETITRTYRVTDDCGNTADVQQLIIVEDVTAPVMAAAPADITVNCVGDIPADPGLGWTDNCDGSGSVAGVDSGLSGGCPATMTRTWTYTDACGNTAIAAVQTITVDDQVAPLMAAAPADITVNCIGDIPADPGLGWTDNCDGSGSVTGVDSGLSGGCPATMTRTWTYTDACGNTAIAAVQTITVDDQVAPVFAAPPADVTVCPGNVPAMTNLGWTDNCDGSGDVVGSDASDGNSCPEIITRSWTYTDACGNTTTVSQAITVDDNQAPVFDPPPADITVECAGDVPPMTDLDWIDNCAGSGTVTGTDTPLSDPCGGTITRSWTYTDACGNTTTVSQTITVDDTTDPTASDLPDQVGTPPAPDPSVVTDEADNCSVPNVAWVSDVSDGGVCPEIITRTYSVTDACGNQILVTQTFTVGDAIFPTASNPLPINEECAADVPAPDPAVVTDENDNGATPIVTWEDDTSDGNSCPEVISRRYRVTDDCGNFIFVTQTITILPITAPLVPADDASTVDCVADAQVQPIPPVVTDVCGNALTPVVTAPAAVACEGDMIWTFTFTDCAGNSSDWNYTYTVDVPAFTIPYGNGTSIVNCPVDGSVQPADPGPVSDQCGNVLAPVITAPAAVSCEGDMVWTFTYTDCAGNTADWTYTYTVDVPAFAISYGNGSSTVNCIADANVQPADPGPVTDECGNVLTPVVTAPAAVACEGDMSWTFTYTDCAGNTADWTYTYTVDVPAFTIPYGAGASIVNCPADGNVLPADPGPVTDACGNVLTPVVTAPAAVACEGDMIWTFTYTDCAGNTADWTYTYTVDLPAFTIPFVDGASAVNCPVDAVDPGAPGVVNDECGNAITPVVTPPSAIGCTGGTMDWVYTYTDCAGNSADWTYSYTVNMAPFALPAADGSIVACLSDAQVQPTPPAMNDMCGTAILPTVVAPADISCEGTMDWVFTYTDCAGNTADWTYTYTVDYSGALTPPAAGSSIVNCAADATDPGAPADILDACGNPVSAVLVGSSPAPACEGGIVWTYRYTSCDGSTTIDWTYTYTIDIPAFTIPYGAGASIVNCPADGNAQPADPGPVTDECGNVLTPVVTAPAVVACEGDMTWTFTYTDCAGNTADWTYTYTVDVPAFTIPYGAGASIVNCPADADVQPTTPGPVTDECGNVLTPSFVIPLSATCEGDVVWVFTYTDCAGNTADWTYTYTIDIPAFTIPYGAGASIVNCPADGNVQPADPGPVADECGNVLAPVVTAPSAVACEGGMVWTFTYTDCAGNTADWTYTYTVDMPAFTIPYANGASIVNCVADANIQPADPGPVTDDCGNVLTPVVTAPAAVACEGDMTWTFTYTDCAGNTADWIYTYTVDVPPFTIPYGNGASIVNCISDANIQPADPGPVTDECGNVLNPVVTAPTAVACEGDMTWTFTYTDCAGNTADWTYTYTVDVPAFTILYANGSSIVNCVADANNQPVDPGPVTDECGNVLTPVVTAPVAVACEGDMTWTFTYTDCAGNTADWTYTYTVDVPAFTIPYPAGASTVNCPADAGVQPTTPGPVTDECGNVLTTSFVIPLSATCEGDVVWVFTYTDCAGNSADWTYTYTVDVPAFTIPYVNGSSTVDCVADAEVQPADPGPVTDECGNVLIPSITAATPVACEGDMVWTFTYTDCAGNTADWTYTYTVDMPTFTLPADGGSTIECIAQAVTPVPPVVTDVCGNNIVPTMTELPDPICEGDKEFRFNYTDCAGNTADWVYIYTIDLITSPVVPTNGTEAVACITDIYVPTPPVVTDQCGNAIVPVMTEGPDPVCVGDKVYTFTYTDCAGSVTDWTYTFSINDNIAPTASNPATLSITYGPAPAPDPTVVIDEADNCAVNPTVAFVSESSDGNVCPETITRIYSVTDDCGNQITVTQQIVITGEYAPINAGPDETICDGESIVLTADNPLGANISWDNGVTDGVSFTPGQTMTFTVTADNGGCISSDDVTVTVESVPQVSFIADVTSGCEPLTVVFTNTTVSGSALDDCIWDLSATQIEGCGSVSYTFPGGTFDVTLTTTSVNGCSASATYTDYIYVEELPVADFTVSNANPSTLWTEVDFYNNSTGSTSYEWNFGDNTGLSSEIDPTHTFPQDGSNAYVVQLVAFSPSMCSDTTWLAIDVDEELIFYVPNTFTPDDDNFNQLFAPVFTSGFDPYDFNLLIFNRWGEVIWESHNAEAGWDGTYGGMPVQDGTYTWKIEFKTSANDERMIKTGHVNVIR